MGSFETFGTNDKRTGSQVISEWLYGPWTKEKYGLYSVLDKVPGIHEYMDYLLDVRADREYMDRYQLSWNDIHDPRKLRQSGSSNRLVGKTYQMVSRNVNSLYRDAWKEPKKSRRRR